MTDIIARKLAILADAAKYDSSCASSSAPKRNSRDGGLGSTTGAGICHSYTPDGRCVSLLKVLLTNFCIFDCAYCVSRRSSNVERARFKPEELVHLTMELYRRNCIEGLFLSSGIARSVDETMKDLIAVAKSLRLDHDFRGYIHLKIIPGASEDLITEAGLYSDRLSVNAELPVDASLKKYAPEKSASVIRGGMAQVRARIDDAQERRKRKSFAPAGQSTQIIIGADATDDRAILATSGRLYASYGLRRVYYSAFAPTQHASNTLPFSAAPLMREHRLYQADWLFRYYGFGIDEVVPSHDGMLPLDMDPKSAWALAHRDRFPIDVNRASREMLLRVPGLGVRAVDRIVIARRHMRLTFADLTRISNGLSRAKHFLSCADHHPGVALDSATLGARIARRASTQLDLFAA